MKAKLIDAHCHLDFESFDDDREAVLKRAHDNGIEHIIIPGVDISNWEKIAELSTGDKGLSACYGLHPYLADKHRPEHIDALYEFVSHHECVAIGECGLDFRQGQADRDKQQYYFEAQLAIAARLDKPIVIHSVKATQQVIDTLARFPDVTGMVHSYSGSYEQATQLIAKGFYLSFGGAVTYERATKLRDVVTRLPLESILLETDAPDQSGAQHEGQRNEPAWITEVLVSIAELKGVDSERLGELCSQNTRRLFSL